MSFLSGLLGILGGPVGAVAGNVVGAVASISSQNKARRQSKQDAANKFVDLRDAAIAGGFNPLTALQATGGAGFGAYTSSAPPLASIELLTGAMDKIHDQASGAAAIRHQMDVVNLQRAKLALEKDRAAVVAAYAPPSSARSVGGGSPRLGGNTTVVGTVNAGVATGPQMTWLDKWLYPGRDKSIKPVENLSGTLQVENTLTGGPVTIGGSDGDPWGLEEWVPIVVQGAPQVVWNWGKRVMKSAPDGFIDMARRVDSLVAPSPLTPAQIKRRAESAAIYERLNQEKPEWLKVK